MRAAAGVRLIVRCESCGHQVPGAEAVEVSIRLLEQRLADALAINVAHDVPPPFGLLQVVERLGLGPIHPDGISPHELVEALIADLPSARTDTGGTGCTPGLSQLGAGVRDPRLMVRGRRACRKASATTEDAETADRGGLGPAASHKTEILGRTLRLDGSDVKGGCRRRG